MAVITCPECGANFEVPNPDRESVFCPYCGTQFDIAPFVRYAYASQQQKHTETEPVYKKRKAHDESDHESNAYHTGYAAAKGIKFYRANKRKCTITAVVLIILFFVGGTALSNHAVKQQEQRRHQAELAQLQREQIAYSHLAQGEVQMPDIEIDTTTATDYRIVKQDLEDAGFTNITTEPVADLNNTATARYNAVIEVTVDGVPRMNVGEWYKLDVPIVITYHTVGDTILTPEQQAHSILQGLLHGKAED